MKNDGVAQYSSMGYMDFVKGYFAAKLDGVAQYSSMGLWEELPRESEELGPLWNVGLTNTRIEKTQKKDRNVYRKQRNKKRRIFIRTSVWMSNRENVGNKSTRTGFSR